METALISVAGFFLGSVPFSVIVGRFFLGEDIRDYGDGNPGATNAWKAGGWKIGLLAGLLDFSKGAAPVLLARYAFDVSGVAMVPVALAPVAGHAFSPLLKFRGGKALAVTFGIWTALTLWEAPVVLGLLFAALCLVQTEDAWSVLIGMGGLLVYLLVRGFESSYLYIWLGNTAILVLKHFGELGRPMHLKPGFLRLIRRST